MTRTWRRVQHATWRSKRSLSQNWRDGREWVLALECGHVEYRMMRYSGPAASVNAWTLEQAIPAPKRVLCHKCEQERGK